MTDFEFIEITPGPVELGWRFDGVLPIEAADAMAEFALSDDFRTFFFSPRRTVTVPPFRIATTAVPWDTLFACDDYGDLANLAEACSRFETELAKLGWRLPTEDEFEIAAGGELFAWGNEIPDWIPYGKQTFSRHKERTSRGLLLNDDPYQVELVSTVFKMGDGGVSICGGNNWPIAWLSLSPTYRVVDEMIEQALPEFLESSLVRPVLL
jgi:hypothetical protein